MWHRSSNAPYRYLWWHVDPRDRYGCCEDCRHLAANSPYVAPGTPGGNILDATPGDGYTSCGAACTCETGYEPPQFHRWQPLDPLWRRVVRTHPDRRRALLGGE